MMENKPLRKAILLAAYGASNFRGKECLRNFENQCRIKFPGVPVRWAFTSLPIIERLARERQKSDSIAKALMKLAYEKFDIVAVQPLQTIPGKEYEDVLAHVAYARDNSGLCCEVGQPLLNNAEDAEIAALALLADLPGDRKGDEDVIFMGHGARHPAAHLYEKLDAAIKLRDSRVHIGAMEGKNGLNEILPRLSSRRVWLIPLLSLMGKHAMEDMAGSSPFSWKSRLEENGHECAPVLHGMAENEAIAEIWLNHLRKAATCLTGNKE